MSTRIDLDDLAELEAEWRTAVDELGQATRRAVDASAKAGQAAGRVHAPHRSYALRDSVDGRVTGATGMAADGEVRADVPYAAIVVDGSKPHEIVPSKKSVLQFEVNGETVFTKRVHHPGTRPNDFMDRAEDAAEKELGERMDEAAAKAVNQVGR